MSTKITVEVEVDIAVDPEALRGWMWSGMNFAAGTELVVSADSPEELAEGLEDLDSLNDYDGPVHVRLCPSPLSIYPPATEQPEPELPPSVASNLANHADLWQRIVETYGYDRQLLQLCEEMSELTVALSHLVRGRSSSWRDVADEVADVRVLLEQVPHIVAGIFDDYDEHMDLASFEPHVGSKIRRTIASLREDLVALEGCEE